MPDVHPLDATDTDDLGHQLGRLLGRRALVRAGAGLTVAGGAVAGGVAPAVAGRRGERGGHHRGHRHDHGRGRILQPGTGSAPGTYVRAEADEIWWGQLPNRTAEPVAVVRSGSVVTLDTVSHEGVLEDQGQDPVAYFDGFGVPRRSVLEDAVAVARRSVHDGPGPHVVTGPIAVTGAEPGDVLKIEVLRLQLRVPYGVISNRHGKGALPGEYPEQFADDPANDPYFNQGGNISVFTEVRKGRGVLPGEVPASFGLAPFMGLMGVARDTTALVDSVPPTDAGGNIDINDLQEGSTLYLPVQVPGAMFFSGDPHMAQGDGEVALTAMEGSLRPTFRLTAVKPGSSGAPSPAFGYPFAETPDHWLPIGLSDPDGPEGGGNETSLDLAMRTAVRQAMAFLTEDVGMPGPVAYAYLSAASDFQVSQVVDRTTGIHALIRKSDLG